MLSLRRLIGRRAAPRPVGFPTCLWLTWVVGAVASGAMVLRMFVPTITGLADDGSSHRLTCPLGLVPHNTEGTSPFFDFLVLRWDRGDPTIGCPDFPTSERWFLSAAQTLTSWFGLPGAVDLRMLGLWWCVLAGSAVAALFALLRTTLLRRAVAAAALFTILADSAFVDYAASMNVQLAAMSGVLIASLGAILLFSPAKRLIAGCMLFSFGGVLAIGAEPGNAILVLPFLAVLSIIRVPWRAMTGRLACRLIPGLCALGLAVVSLTMYVGEDARLEDTRAYNQAFLGILGNSSDPHRDSEDLGLPPTFAAYAGQSWWAHPTALENPSWPTHARSISTTSIRTYLLGHPGQALNLVSRSAKDLLSFRPAQTGTYPREVGAPPRSADCRWCAVSAIGQIFAPRALPALLLYLSVCGLLAAVFVRALPKRHPAWQFGAAAGFLTALATVSFASATLSDPLESTKAMILPAFIACLVPAMFFCMWCVSNQQPLTLVPEPMATPPLAFPQPKDGAVTVRPVRRRTET
ncbi:glycan biosynthesis hexose transferase WsfD [Streptomyces roseus]